MRSTAYFGFCLIIVGGGGFYASLLAHLRVRLNVNKHASFLDAWHSLKTSPEAFLANSEASLLFVLSLILFGVTAWKAPSMYDYLWGCSAANRQAEQDRAEVDAEADKYRDETLPDIQHDVISRIDEDLEDASEVFDKAIRICGRAVADDDLAQSRRQQSQDAYFSFRNTLAAELRQLGAEQAAAAPQVTDVAHPRLQGAAFLHPAQVLLELQRQRAELFDQAEKAKDDMRKTVTGEINALPDALEGIAKAVLKDITTPPARPRS